MVVAVAQINFVVADLERSRAFYAHLGVSFRARNRHGQGDAEAWVSTNTGVTIVLHSTAFAAWWDETAPQPSPGGSQVDLELDSAAELDEIIAELVTLGTPLIKPPANMPWGQRFGIVLDPDGHRIGLKAPAQ